MKLSQVFLINPEIAKTISRLIVNQDLVVEIGIGDGILTTNIIKTAKAYIGIDIDRHYVNKMKQKLITKKNISLFCCDILKFNFEKINHLSDKISLCGNLPYHITGAILAKIMNNYQHISEITIMVQKEVGKRIIATPNTKKFNSLSVIMQCLFSFDANFVVKKTEFNPVPKVDSLVIHGRQQQKIPSNFLKFKEFVNYFFTYKRKFAYKSFQLYCTKFNIDSNLCNKIIENFKLKKYRAEQLDNTIIYNIFQNLCNGK